MRHRTLALALVGLFALAGFEGASGGVCRVLAVQRASALLASMPGLSVGRVSARDGMLSIEHLDVRAGRGARLRIGRLTLPTGTGMAAGFVGPAAAEPAGIAATDVSITIGRALITIPRIAAQGTYLTPDRLTSLLDPSTSLSAADRLKELTAASLTAPTVTITAAPPAAVGANPPAVDDGGKAVLEDVALTDVVAGRIGSVSVRKTTIFKTATVGAPVVASFGAATLDEVDLPLAARIAETGRTDPAEVPQALYGSLSLRDVMIAPDDTGTLRLGAITADGFRGRPLLRRPADLVALIDKPSGSQTPEDARTLAEVAVDAAKGFSLDHLEWDDVTLLTTETNAASFKLGRIAIDGMTPVRIGTWALADLAFSSAEASFTLGRMALRGPDESQLVDTLAQQLAISGLAMDRTRLMSGVPADGSLSMVGLHFEAPSSDDEPGNSPDGHHHVFDVPVVSFAAETNPSTRIATTTAHLQATYALPAASANPGFAALARKGFSALDARADYRMSFDPQGKELRLDPLTIAADKLGRVSLSTDVGNVPFDLLGQGHPSSDAEAAFGQVLFKGFTLDFRNDGAVELALPVLAASADTSVPMLRAGAKTQSDLFIGQTLGATPAAERLEAAIDAFIDDPKTLHIVVTAPAGLSGAEIQAAPDPKSLLDRVGIEATANK